jgi:hypothetical protein
MKNKINSFIDGFEKKFNYIIDITALIGSVATILMSITIFILLLTNGESILDGVFIIFLPGFLGFSAILMLFALRITRHITKKDTNDK